MGETEQINRWANRALENLQGGWYALCEHQLRMIVDATGGPDPLCICPPGWVEQNGGWHRGPQFCPRYDIDVRRRPADRAAGTGGE